MPIVFCASLPPWPRLYRPADSSCSRRKRRSTLLGAVRKYSHDTPSMNSEPRMKPSSGEMKMNATVFNSPSMFSELQPDFASAAPTRPPISACDELDGIP